MAGRPAPLYRPDWSTVVSPCYIVSPFYCKVSEWIYTVCLGPFFGMLDFNGLIQKIQSALVILNSKGLSETLQDIRTSTYQSCGSEENNKSNNHI